MGEPVPDPAALRALMAELVEPLRADGADLDVEHTGEGALTFTLHVADATCAECVMPGPFLADLFAARTAAHLGGSWTVVLVDPRAADPITR